MGVSVSLASRGPAGQGFNGASDFVELSADAAYLVFQSDASNAFLGDGNGAVDIWRQRQSNGLIERVSQTPTGAEPNGASFGASISGDGRLVAFTSFASNLVGADLNGFADVFLRDMASGSVTLLSAARSGGAGNSVSFGAAVSSEGGHVAFLSAASNLVAGDSNSAIDVFVRDLSTGITTRATTGADGTQQDGGALNRPALSADGRYVVFDSLATNLAGATHNALRDHVFVKDLWTGDVRRASEAADGTAQNGGFQGTLRPQISADGRYVVFASNASNLVADDRNGVVDVFRKDLWTGWVELVSVSTDGQQGNASSLDARISADGAQVLFTSHASNFAADDRPLSADIFIRDMQTGALTLVSTTPQGRPGFGQSVNGALSADGTTAAFASAAPDLVAADANAQHDAFVAALRPPAQQQRGAGGEDTLTGTVNDDTLEGLEGNDLLLGGEGNDWLMGGAGDDRLDGQGGGNLLFGGLGDDAYVVRSGADRIFEHEDEGSDSAWVRSDGWTLPAHVEIGRLAGEARLLHGGDGGVQLVANQDHASTLVGGSGHDVLWGGALDGQHLSGGAGDDILRAGGGRTSMQGGAGDDQFVVRHRHDSITEHADGGMDTAGVGVSGWVAAEDVEIVRLFDGATDLTLAAGGVQAVSHAAGARITASGGDVVFWGHGGADTFLGGVGDDIFFAGGGRTAMTGGAGNDQFVVRHVADTAVELAEGGYDTAWVAVDGWRVADHVEVAYLSGEARSLRGNDTGGNLVANPGLGSSLTAGAGYTVFWGSNHADVMTAGAGGARFYGYGGADLFGFAEAGWHYAEIADFNRAEGDRLVFQGIGWEDLTFFTGGGHTLVRHGTHELLLYNVDTSLTRDDILFS